MIYRVTVNFVLAALIVVAQSWVQPEGLAAEQSVVALGGEAGSSSSRAALPTDPPKLTGSVEKPLARDKVMARVGDQMISVDDFTKYVAQDTRSVKMATTDQGKVQVLREMILDRLIEEGMRREGFLPKDHSPTQPDYLRGYNLLAAKHFPEANKTPDEKMIHQYYLDHQEEFGIPAMVRVGQIQFRVPANANAKDRKTIKSRATKTWQRLKAGESFAALAGKLTENPQAKATEGDLGFLPVNQDPWLKAATAGLAIGQYSTVLESPVGYEILQLKDRRDALIAPYPSVREKVLARMRQEAQRKGREDYARRLAKEVGVTVEIDELKSAIP